MRFAKKAVPALVALTALAAIAGCGSSDSDGGSNALTGKFEPVSGAPAGYAGLSGEATLERADGGTEVSLRASGLKPRHEYVAHLHSGGCDEADPGGPHFKFDPQGSDEPPNEIHLEFTADGAGDGEAETSSDREVPAGEAGSIVLHSVEDGHEMVAFVHGGHEHGEESHPDQLACAELEGGGPPVASAGEGPGGQESDVVPTIVIQDGEPVNGIQELEYSAGDQVRFTVDSDVADEIHVHGYDLMKDVTAGGSATFEFPAEIEGIFEVELEGRKEQIAELRVNP